MDLTKFGIVCFILVSGFAGYAMGLPAGQIFNGWHLFATLASLYFFSAGSFAINQAQEWRIDRQMPRTTERPIPSGRISVAQAWMIGVVFIGLGVACGFVAHPRVVAFGLLTVVMYNVLYTLYWKKRWAFGAVPGALPGAMPVVIGYSATAADIWHSELLYAFLIMFLWQMPHFWALAIRFKDDYVKGGIPVLPARIGTIPTLFHMGLYVFAYVGLALISPWFTSAHFLYVVAVVPFALKVLYEFFRYYNAKAEKRWLSFFLWTNFSVLVFLIAPVVDKWYRAYISQI